MNVMEKKIFVFLYVNSLIQPSKKLVLSKHGRVGTNMGASVELTGAGSLDSVQEIKTPILQIDDVLKDKPWISYGSTIPGGGKECADYSMEQVNQGEGNYTAVGGGLRNQLTSKVMHMDGAPFYKLEDCAGAIATIDENLEKGWAVMVGVDYKDGNAGNANTKTDHYVTIVGKGEDQNGTYYSYYDNYTGRQTLTQSEREKIGRDLSKNRFRPSSSDSCVYSDSDGNLPYNANETAKEGYPSSYTITEVRENE